MKMKNLLFPKQTWRGVPDNLCTQTKPSPSKKIPEKFIEMKWTFFYKMLSSEKLKIQKKRNEMKDEKQACELFQKINYVKIK